MSDFNEAVCLAKNRYASFTLCKTYLKNKPGKRTESLAVALSDCWVSGGDQGARLEARLMALHQAILFDERSVLERNTGL